METRREFVKVLTTASCLFAGSVALAQIHPTYPKPPKPGDPEERDKNSGAPNPQTTTRAAAHKNENEFRAGVERLYQLSSELREELQKTTTTNVLSVPMYKKTEEIEKLAKQLKTLAKGG